MIELISKCYIPFLEKKDIKKYNDLSTPTNYFVGFISMAYNIRTHVKHIRRTSKNFLLSKNVDEWL